MLRSPKTISLRPVLESHRCRTRSWPLPDLLTACYGQGPGRYLGAASHACAAQNLALLTVPQKFERAPPRSDYACIPALEPNYRFLTSLSSHVRPAGLESQRALRQIIHVRAPKR